MAHHRRPIPAARPEPANRNRASPPDRAWAAYFRDRFGIAPTTGYNVDSFGHTASLPDILAAHGYTGYVFRRPEQHQVPLPGNTFVWRGVKGGNVIAFRISPGYVANFAELPGR